MALRGASSRNGINNTPRSLKPFPDLVHLTHLSAKSLRAGYTGTSLQGVLRSPVTARECPLSVRLAGGLGSSADERPLRASANVQRWPGWLACPNGWRCRV